MFGVQLVHSCEVGLGNELGNSNWHHSLENKEDEHPTDFIVSPRQTSIYVMCPWDHDI